MVIFGNEGVYYMFKSRILEIEIKQQNLQYQIQRLIDEKNQLLLEQGLETNTPYIFDDKKLEVRKPDDKSNEGN